MNARRARVLQGVVALWLLAAPGTAPPTAGALPLAGPSDGAPRIAGQGAAAARLGAQLRWRNIGPANMMGRIASIDALASDYRVVLVGSASGGVFLSRNAGVTWEPIFDAARGAGSIGDAVFFQGDPDVIWVGTGEAANRNSSGWGDGVWRSTDGGKTWEQVGLESTHHIAAIATHPTDPEVAYVAAPGHLWGYSGERGLFRTRDGGRTWQKLTHGLPDDGRTGCTEVVMDPSDPEVLYAGFYHRLRQPWSMVSGGGAGGVFKSTDGGDTWRRLTRGLPAVTGMIDLDIHRADPRIVVAFVEADDDTPYDEHKPARDNPPGPGIYRSRDGGESWEYLLRTNVRPFYHGQVAIDPLEPNRIYSVGREFKVTKDGGATWIDRWWRGGGDDHDLWIAPSDGAIRYMATDQGAYLTLDDGATVLAFDNMAIGQYYKVGVDMRDPYWVVGGLQDNAVWITPSNSRDVQGILNRHSSWLAEGDGFAAQVDPTDWRTVYAVNHVGFAVRLNVQTRAYRYITPTPETIVNFDEVFEPDFPEEPIRYTIAPGEHWFFGERAERPLLPPQFRFNWNSPLRISPNNPRTIYFAGNYLFKSVDRGDTWRVISPDLSKNDPARRNPSEQGGLTRSVTGGENHFTIFTVAESPLDPALVWAGTDDGNVQITQDGGATWRNVRDHVPGLPEEIWVSRIEASHHARCRAYAAFDNHRLDDFRPRVFRTDDCGESWQEITGDLPASGSSYVVVEDPVNDKLLFVGTEFGAFATIDGGGHWFALDDNLPVVAVRDLVIHPRDADLVAGTHGRSLWILDDITPLRQATAAVLGSEAWLFAPRRATAWQRVNTGRKQPHFLFRGENPPRGALLHVWLRREPSEPVSLRVQEVLDGPVVGADARAGAGSAPGREAAAGAAGLHVAWLEFEPHAGLNRVRWDLRFPPTLAEREAFAERMHRAIATLTGRVGASARSAALRARLAEIEAELEAIDLAAPPAEAAGPDERQPTPEEELNAVRRALVQEFGAFAGGREIFGPKIGPTEAAAGVYRVVLRVGDKEFVQPLQVRADPLLRGRPDE